MRQLGYILWLAFLFVLVRADAQTTIRQDAPVTLVVTSPPINQATQQPEDIPTLGQQFGQDNEATSIVATWLVKLLQRKGWQAYTVSYVDEVTNAPLRWHIMAFTRPVQTYGYDLPTGNRSTYVQQGQAAAFVTIDRVDPHNRIHCEGFATAGSREVQTTSNNWNLGSQFMDYALSQLLSKGGTPERAQAKAISDAFAKALGQIGELPTAHTTTAGPAATNTFQPGMQPAGSNGYAVIGPDGPITTTTPAAQPAATIAAPAAPTQYPIRRSSASPDSIIIMGITSATVGQEFTITGIDGGYLGRLKVTQVLSGNQVRCRVIDANTYLLTEPENHATPAR